MGEWRGCACGEGFYFERLQPRMTGERLAGYLNALSDERARAALQRCCGARHWVDAMLAALAQGNVTYEERFGHVFLISATGKTADEMLGALRGRLSNDPATELRVAAEEQAKITRLRLDKLVAS